MRERNLIASSPRGGRADKPSRNLLLDQALLDRRHHLYSNFSPLPWLSIFIHVELWAGLANHMRADLVCDALNEALVSRRWEMMASSSFTDRGSQYGSKVYRQILQEAGITQSMSRRANPYDNAWTESFMSTLKREMLQDGCFIDTKDAHPNFFPSSKVTTTPVESILH